MVRAWRIRDDDLDENRLDKKDAELEFVDGEYLKEKLGVIANEYGTDLDVANKRVDQYKEHHQYAWEDCLEIHPDSENVDDIMKKFAQEHLHDEEESRFVLEGCAYFDIRELNDQNSWIRVEVTKGDLIVVPAGLYHRLTLDEHKLIKLRRLFSERNRWLAFNRPEADSSTVRQQYLATLATS